MVATAGTASYLASLFTTAPLPVLLDALEKSKAGLLGPYSKRQLPLEQPNLLSHVSLQTHLVSTANVAPERHSGGISNLTHNLGAVDLTHSQRSLVVHCECKGLTARLGQYSFEGQHLPRPLNGIPAVNWNGMEWKPCCILSHTARFQQGASHAAFMTMPCPFLAIALTNAYVALQLWRTLAAMSPGSC